MDVGVGSTEDPANLQGCAHFCEHLLFLGTEKYPEENAFSTYLTANNATYNAYTDVSNTNYYFEIAPEAFEGALDRFAGFFTAPLFNESCTEREVNAVNAEQNKNLQNDSWRHFQLRKHLSSPQHPFHMFPVGSRETLWDTPRREGRDPRAELIEWWERTYCAKRMKLVILAQEKLDTLEAWVRDRFEGVPVRTEEGSEKLVYHQEVMTEGQLGQFVFAEPVKDIRSLKMYFPFPDQGPLYASKPNTYLSHLLGHEGPGSLLSCLKRRGWASSLSAGCQMNTVGFDFFSVQADLTPEGLLHYQEVALTMCRFISLLRHTPPREQVFQELKKLSDIRFRFVERSRPAAYVSDVATWLQHPTPREKVISSQWVIQRFDPDEISSAVKLLDLRRGIVFVTAKTMPSDVGPLDQTEPVFGTKYRLDKIPEDFITAALAPNPMSELQLPGSNKFIPENLEVDKTHEPVILQMPTLLRDTPLSRLWHKKDDQFWIPRVNVSIALKSPLLDVTPRLAILSQLYCDLFRDSVAEEIYDAKLAGLNYILEHGSSSIKVKLRGYHDKLPELTKKMMQMLKEFRVDNDRFGIVKDQLERECTNFELYEPYNLLGYYASYATSQRAWTPSEELAELACITAEDVQLFGHDFFARMYIETVVHGNMDDKGAVALQDMVESIISTQPLSTFERVPSRSLLLPASSEHVWRLPVANPDNINSAIDYHCHVGNVENDFLRPRLCLLARLAEAPVFDILRTKEQLGYMIFSSARISDGSMGFRVLLQSEKPAAFLETRIEAFLDYFKNFLEEMSDDDFRMTRQGLVSTHAEKPKNLLEESSRFWKAVHDGYYDFNRRFRDMEQIKHITKQEVIDLFMAYIHPSSGTRSKMSIHMDSHSSARKCTGGDTPSEGPSADSGILETRQNQGENVFKRSEASIRPSNVFIENIAEWKAGLLCGPAARPVKKLVVGSKQ